jgi:DNA replication protein DnaC
MTTDQLQLQMSRLKLSGMARSWQALNETRRTHELSLAEGMEILLQAEQQQRVNRRFERLHKNARFRYQASVEELIFDPARGLDKALISNLATGEYLEKGESILVTGSSGTGKSFLISALGAQACAQGYSVAYFNMQKLMVKTRMARIEGTILKFFEKLAKTGLLVLDDVGLTNLEAQQQLDLMEIIEDRHARASTIMASQLPVASWYDVIGPEPTVADAILDRLVHTSYRIEFLGCESLRKKR